MSIKDLQQPADSWGGARRAPFLGLLGKFGRIGYAGLASLVLCVPGLAQEPGEVGPASEGGAAESSQTPVVTPPVESPAPPRRLAPEPTDRPPGFVAGPVLEVLGSGSESRADYAIDARVEAIDVDGVERFTLDGSERIRWTNRSSDAVDELWFHVYLNAFASTHTTVLRSAGGVLRGHRIRDGWGWTDIQRVALVGDGNQTTDLTAGLTFERPTDGNPDDFTVFRVALPAPLAPGASVTVEIDWFSRLPRVRRRTGTKDDFMLVAQWFPKLGVYETGRGWNCHQFHAFSEWYADYGTYDVSLDLPIEFKGKVFGSGVRVRELERGERVVVDFAAPSVDDRRRSDLSGRAPLVHDFTWTADPDFETRTATFRFADWAERFPAEIERARRAFGEDAPLELRDVTIEALIQPERAVQAERHVEATAAALFFYGLWFGEYPFERITVVDPAWGARAAGGMEYPTIFTAGTRLFTDSTMHSPESVTIHEAGHQWFYLLSANNEFEAAWLDEGLNSYADSEVIARVYGPRRGTTDYMGVPVDGRRLFSFGRGKLGSGLTLRSVPVPPLDWIGLDDLATVRPVRTNGILDWWRDQPLLSAAPERSDVRWSDRGSAINGDHADPIDTWAWRSKTRSSHYTNTYSRTATILRSMPAFLEASTGEDGDAAFLRAIRGFATEWRFRHPYPDDFFVAMEAHDGLDLELDWFFAELFRQVSTVDWRLDVREVVEPELLGATRGDDGRFVIAAEVEPEVPEAADEDPEAAGEEPVDQETTVPETVAADDDPDAGEERVWEIALEREGNLALPVLVRLNFENGTSAEFVWTRAEQLGERWLKVRYASRSPLVSAVVDPDGGYYLEQSRANNGWYADRGGLSVTRWTERIFAQAASFLRFQKGLGG